MERKRIYFNKNIVLFFIYYICLQLMLSKEVNHLGQKWKKGIPIEVIPMSCKPIQQKIEGKYGGEAILRMSADKAVS